MLLAAHCCCCPCLMLNRIALCVWGTPGGSTPHPLCNVKLGIPHQTPLTCTTPAAGNPTGPPPTTQCRVHVCRLLSLAGVSSREADPSHLLVRGHLAAADQHMAVAQCIHHCSHSCSGRGRYACNVCRLCGWLFGCGGMIFAMHVVKNSVHVCGSSFSYLPVIAPTLSSPSQPPSHTLHGEQVPGAACSCVRIKTA